MHRLGLSSVSEHVLRLWGEQMLFLPSFKGKIHNFISTMKVKIFSTSELELFSFDWSKLTFTWHIISQYRKQ